MLRVPPFAVIGMVPVDVVDRIDEGHADAEGVKRRRAEGGPAETELCVSLVVRASKLQRSMNCYVSGTVCRPVLTKTFDLANRSVHSCCFMNPRLVMWGGSVAADWFP